MTKAISALYNGFGKTKLAIVLFVAAVYSVLVCYGGGSLLQLALFAFVMGLYILVPGVAMATYTKANTMLTGYFWPLAFLYGSGLFAVLYAFSMRLHILWLLRFLPPLFSVVFLALQIRERRKSGKGIPQKVKLTPNRWLLLLLIAALVFLYTFASVVKNARPAQVGDVLLNQDMLWNIGNANSFKIAFPPQDIRFYDVRLHYHYLTELLVGALSIVSGIPAFNIVGFYMQPYMLAAMVISLYCFGKLLWRGHAVKPMLFVFSHFLFSCASLWKTLPNGHSVFWNSYLTHIITNINSQATAIVFLCIFIGLFVEASRRQYKISLLYFGTLLCSFIMLCFSKGPLAAIVTVALVLAVLFGLLQKKTGWRGLLIGASIAGMFLFIYLTMFSSGANTSMPFSFVGTLEKGYFYNIMVRLGHENHTLWLISIPVLWVLQSFLMLPATFLLYIRSISKDIVGLFRLPTERLLFQAASAGGLLAFFWFNHPSMSQTYFLFTAVFFIHILAVDGIDYLRWPTTGEAGKIKVLYKKAVLLLMGLFAAVGIATTGFLYIHLLGSGARQLARNLGVIEKYPYDVVVTADDELAMLWLRDNSDTTTMFATNRIHTGARKEGISNLYSAFCERQGYMEGFQYALTNMGVSVAVINERLAVNEALFSAETPPEQVVQLCLDNRIEFLVYSTQFDGSNMQMSQMELVYDSDSVQVYRVPA